MLLRDIYFWFLRINHVSTRPTTHGNIQKTHNHGDKYMTCHVPLFFAGRLTTGGAALIDTGLHSDPQKRPLGKADQPLFTWGFSHGGPRGP